MAKQFDTLDPAHIRFIQDQHVYFTASAAPDGRVNVSPKGMDSLRVLDGNRIAWLSVTGSGNETAGHLLEHPRITLMWCSFTSRPMILRTYGTARAIYPQDADWAALEGYFPTYRGARQIFDMSIDLVQTSCGYAVPFLEYQGDRDTLQKWTADKSDKDLQDYQAEKNQKTIDGKTTGLPV